MNVTTDELYRIIGQLYVTVSVLNERVKVLTPKPTPLVDDDQELGIHDLARANGA